MGIGFVTPNGQDLGDLLVRRDFFASKQAYVWGRGVAGGLGDGTFTGKSSPSQISGTWKKISLASSWANNSWLEVGGQLNIEGDAEVFAIRGDGTLYGWGRNSVGTLTIQADYPDLLPGVVSNSPVQIGTNKWLDVAVSASITTDVETTGNCFCSVAAVRSDGTLWTWGFNGKGDLGLGDVTSRSSPVQVGTRSDWVKVFPKYGGFFATNIENALYGWGYNLSGNIGDSTVINKSSPVIVIASSSVRIKDVTTTMTANAVTFAQVANSNYLVWGVNTYGGFGNNAANTAASSTPSLYTFKVFDDIGCSRRTVHAIDKTGQLWAWGSNIYGQVGDNTTVTRSSPVQIASGTSFLKMSRSPDSYNPHAIASNGSLTSIGGGYNLTGNSSITNFRSSPVSVSSATQSNWLSVSGSLYLITGTTSNDV